MIPAPRRELARMLKALIKALTIHKSHLSRLNFFINNILEKIKSRLEGLCTEFADGSMLHVTI